MMALYRVCNQRSEPGLEAIEAKLVELRPSFEPTDPSLALIETVIEQARDDDWNGAMQKVRELLDQQVEGKKGT
jgi:hypothetical protein